MDYYKYVCVSKGISLRYEKGSNKGLEKDKISLQRSASKPYKRYIGEIPITCIIGGKSEMYNVTLDNYESYICDNFDCVDPLVNGKLSYKGFLLKGFPSIQSITNLSSQYYALFYNPHNDTFLAILDTEKGVKVFDFKLSKKFVISNVTALKYKVTYDNLKMFENLVCLSIDS